MLNKKNAIDLAAGCKGWTDEAKLSLLYDLVESVDKSGVAGDIIEIGSAWGRSMVVIGNASTKKLWSIDPHTGGLFYIKSGTDQGSYHEFLENISKAGLKDRVNVLKHTTSQVISDKLLPENVSVAFAFIDGLHTAEGVRLDLDLIVPRLNKGSIVVFDDYFEPSVKDMKDEIDSYTQRIGAELVKDTNSNLAYFVF